MSRRSIEAALRRDPADEQVWAVFGDLLAETGDSRGELIALEQRARASERPFERALLEHQARELFEREHRAWLGPLADAGLDVTWQRGFASEVVIARSHPSTLATLLQLPTAALLRRLVLVGPRNLARVTKLLRETSERPLEALTVRGLGDGSIDALAELDSLVELSIEGCSIAALGRLAELPNLRKLVLRRCTGDLRGFATGFEHLRSLEISAHAHVEQLPFDALAPLARLTRLRELDLGDAGWPNADALAGLLELERLDLRSTEIIDLEPLRKLTALRELDSSGCTGLTNLEPLSQLTRLERLRLGYTRVRDLRPLAKLERLTTLELDGTPIVDLSPLFGLANLRKLDLKACEILNVAPLLARGVMVYGVRAPERSWRDVAEDHLRRRG